LIISLLSLIDLLEIQDFKYIRLLAFIASFGAKKLWKKISKKLKLTLNVTLFT